MDLQFNEVREYLLESNSIEEAEGILLHNILNKSNDALQRKVVKDSLQQPTSTAPDYSDRLDNLKISDLLGSLEMNMKKDAELQKSAAQGPPKEQETPLEKLDKMKFFDEVTEKELADLEKKRDYMQLKRLANKYEMEKINLIHKPEADAKTETIKAKARNAPIPFPKNSKEAMGQLYELTEEHARRVAQNRAEALTYQREMEQLRQGKWSMNNSYIAAAETKQPVTQAQKVAAGPHSPNDAGAPTSSSEDAGAASPLPAGTASAQPVTQQARLEAILRSVATEDALQAQRQEIAALRQRTSQTDESLRRDPLMQGLSSVIGQSRSSQYEKLDPTARNVNRNMTVPDYLEQWLGDDSATGSSSRANNNRAYQPSKPSKVLMNSGLQGIQETDPADPIAPASRKPSSQAVPDVNVSGSAREGDAVQELISKLMEENRQLHEEKIVLQRDLQPRAAPRGYPSEGSPSRMAPYGGSGLSQFRQQAHTLPGQFGPEGGYGRGYQPYPAPHPSQHGPPQAYGQYSQQYHQQFTQPFPQGPAPFQGAPLSMDPQQQAMMAQLQQMAEQMERENNKLMGQLGGASSPRGPGGAPPLGMMGPPGGEPGFGPQNNPLGNPLGPRGVDNSTLYTLERDKAKAVGGAKPSRQELKHQEEVRKIQQDIEKIKCMGDLDQAQAEYEQSRAKRQKEMEHEKWLLQQKQELQALKIQQVLAKEQRLLRLQQEDGQPGPGAGAGVPHLGSLAGFPGADSVANGRAREDCGVGRNPVPLDIATGITVIVDGLILPRPMQTGGFFRVALGLFDKSGKALVRLAASKWQGWSKATANDKQEGSLQQLGELLTRSLKLSENKVDLANARCLLELQCKEKLDSDQKWIGWGVVPVIRPAAGRNVTVDTTVSKANVLLCNNVWRAVLRKSLSDPAIPDVLAPAEQAEPRACFLLRIVDSTVQQQASAWSLSESEFRTEEQALGFYVDPMASPPVMSPVASSARLLEKDPEIKNLFASGSKSPVGFSSRADMTPDAAPAGFNPKGMLGAMKAVGIMKSRSKGKLTGIPEGGASADGISRKPSTSMIPPSSPGMGAFAGLGKKASDHDAADQADADEKAKQMLRAADDKTYWFLGKPLGPCNDKYQKGDGLDLYFDCAMYLPDNTTVSRITMRIFTADKEQLGEVHECYSLPNSPSVSPVFNHKIELRSSAFNVTSTALIRIDTIDAATLLPASVGYSCIKLFASRDRVQPKTATDLNVCINTGNFQLPLHAGRIPTTLLSLTETMLSTLPKIPAASMLLRILPAPKSADGISTLSKDEFPAAEWARLGLSVPAPTYVSGEYSGSLCEPSDLELVCYRAKSQNPVESVESALMQALAARPAEAAALPPRPAGNETDAIMSWLKSLLPGQDQMRRTIEYSFAVPYSIETGLNVSIENLYNMPDGGIFSSFSTLYKVISSTSPPGLFYKEPPLFDGVFYTKTHRLEAHMRAPAFTDGFYDFTPSSLSRNLYLLLDIRTLRIDSKKGLEDTKITMEPASQRKSYWTLLPLAAEKVAGQGFRYVPCGVYCAPLIEGAIPAEEVFKSPAPMAEIRARLQNKGKASTNLKVVDGALVMVKLLNPLVRDLVLPAMDGPEPIVHTEFLGELLTSAIMGTSGSTARIDRFEVDKNKYPGGGAKATSAQLPKSCQSDLPGLLRLVNKEFETLTGLVSR